MAPARRTGGDRVLEALRACSLLARVPEADLRAAAAASTLRSLRAGQEAYRSGDAGRALFVVERGRIASRLRSVEGGVVDVGFAEAGTLFGYFEVFDGQPRDCDAVATRTSTVVEVPHPWSRRLLTGSTAVLEGVVGDLLSIVRQQNVGTSELRFGTVAARAARLLLAHADEDGRVVLEESQTLLAQRLGTVRQTLNKTLRSLAADGTISIDPGGRSVRVVDRRRLEGLAGRPPGPASP